MFVQVDLEEPRTLAQWCVVLREICDEKNDIEVELRIDCGDSGASSGTFQSA